MEILTFCLRQDFPIKDLRILSFIISCKNHFQIFLPIVF